MKTLSNILIIVISMFIVVPKITTPIKLDAEPIHTDSIFVDELVLEAKKMDIELIKSEIKVLYSEIKYKIPNYEEEN